MCYRDTAHMFLPRKTRGNPDSPRSPGHNITYVHSGLRTVSASYQLQGHVSAHTFATSVMILPMASPFKDSVPWADARCLTLHQGQLPFMFPSCIERPFGEFPSGPVVKIPPCHCRGHGFYPCLGKLRSHMVYSQKIK